MVEVSKKEIKKLSKISGIALSDTEVDEYQSELTKVINSVSQLGEVDVTGVEPTYQVINLTNIWRQDEVQERPVAREELLALAPDSKDGGIKVPKVL